MPWNIFARKAKVEPRRRTLPRPRKINQDLHPMEVVRLHTIQKRYGGQRHPQIESYEVLKERNELVEWRYVPKGDTVIYISHEQVGTDHPDPDGTQFYHLLLLLERLQKGEIMRTDMDAFHSVLYNYNHTTTSQEWKRILNTEKTYIWYDGLCVPASCREDAFRWIPSYIERCSFLIILAPGCTHFDRIDSRTKRKRNLCYRTYRLRALCVFELFSSFLSEKLRPALLVRSGTGTPNWVAPMEYQKLAVGTSIFECCETNHSHIKRCRRIGVRSLLENMTERRAETLFNANEFALARFHKTLSTWWLRGLPNNSSVAVVMNSLKMFRHYLCWNDIADGEWFDRCGISIFMYAVACDNVFVLRELLIKLKSSSSEPSLCAKRLRGQVPKRGVTSLGIPEGLTTLVAAMGFASSEFVSLLLKHGADPFESDVMRNDGLMFACAMGRTNNIKFWLDKFPNWNLKRTNKVTGGVALGFAVFMGPHRLELVKLLINHGASVDFKTYFGNSIITSLCSSEDSDPELLEFLLHREGIENSVNNRARATTLKWRNIYRLARFLTRHNLTDSGLMIALAQDSGATALQYAVQRGDIDVVNILLQHGAHPTIKNDLGKSPVNYCDSFPELRGALKRVIQQIRRQRKGVMRGHTAVIRRDSTATDMKFPMYLVPLDQLQQLYGGKDPRYERIEAHQHLKRRGELVRWKDLPIDAHIIFLSHEWVGWNHPDPHGIQLRTFLKVMQRLRCGDISQVEMNVFHTMMYKTNHVVRSVELKAMLSTAYVC